MTTPLKVATVQFEPTMFEKERNIARLLDMVAEAAAAGAKLIVTPEMGTTGYCWFDREEVAPFVEPIPGPTTERFAAVARAHGSYIVIGMPEVDPATNLYYNAAVLIGPEGVVGTHRKTHPYISEPKWSAPGDLGHQVFDTPIGRIAMLVCMDIHFVETARLAGLGGADIICHISNWLAERTPAPYWITRAAENSCYLIEANRWGLERTVQFSGGSCVIGPDGAIEAVIDAGDGIAFAELDLQRARARRVLGEKVFEQRRPELYMELATSTYSWNPLDFFGLYGHRPLPPGRRSRIAVAQFAPTGDVAANLARIEQLAVQASREDGAELVVFPERAITGLDAPNAQRLDGPAVARLVALATRHRLHIAAGLAEEDRDGTLYNSAVLVGPQGVVGSYRKLHLDASDHNWAKPGDRWGVFDTGFGRIGLLIGHDAAFPEAGRVLALRGCDLVLCLAALRGPLVAAHAGSKVPQDYPIPTGATAHHWHLMRTRAGENNLYLAFANILDEAAGYKGKSGVFGPDTFAFPRREAILDGEEGSVTAEMDTTNLDTRYPTNVVRRKDLVAMRHPHHYRPLIA
ncbi:nitrilase-related carbon-nitrogen hydrolase [Ancylobacter oerskovii]|uniref:Nitrilase-related carbon-nitrogen hydrolase n=1 Tax=Ancylobacter oerskovii TaxID=459519 RepID=A0ABW4YZ76_9HYPH|nr:nitrilase-related carbon-nitrogen hydrolase [Ancylobacter oerskovii]MBS7543982.1 amidohydrolase [Ancylobacter oerskovii]